MKWTEYQKESCGGYEPFWAKYNFDKDERMPYFEERKDELGFYPFEIWNLDTEIVAFILPRLKYFREHHCGCPCSIEPKEWDNNLDKYIEAFQDYLNLKNSEKDLKDIMPVLHKFIDDMGSLWT